MHSHHAYQPSNHYVHDHPIIIVENVSLGRVYEVVSLRECLANWQRKMKTGGEFHLPWLNENNLISV